MNANRERIYNYSYLFVVSLAFSVLGTEAFLLYLFVRKGPHEFTDFDVPIIGFTLWILFSALGQRLSKVNGIRKWILFISGFSSFSYYTVFVTPTIIYKLETLVGIIGIGVGFFAMGWILIWEVLDNAWTFLNQRKISQKFVAVIFFGIGVSGVVIFLVFVYSTTIMSFFDSHPWIMTLLGILATLLGGIFIGRRTKES